jgi:hypothetical protein
MCSHEPGSFTRTIPAIVIPRKTSSETSRLVSVGIEDIGIGGAF